MSTLRVMITEAYRNRLVLFNPFDIVRPLDTDKKEIDILTLEEVRMLFSDIDTIWKGNLVYYTANMLAASTGIRQGAIRAIRDDTTVALTADVPPGPARKAGPGLPTLAKLSGTPILPCAVVTKHYIKLNSWSGFTICLPFSRMVMAGGDPIQVPRDATAEEVERKTEQLQLARVRVHEPL